MNGATGALVGAAATIVAAMIAWWRFWPKDRADVRHVDAETQKTLSDIARDLIDETRDHYEARIGFLEARIGELERLVDELRTLEPEVAELRQQVRTLARERDAYHRWARSLEKQVRELGGHPVALQRFLNGTPS
jgi:predicted nuclease with TOPRIM domain